MKKKLFTLFIAAALTLTSLAGCQSSESPESSKDTAVSSETVDGSSIDTMTVTDARGEVTIPANPQRIVDLSGNSDILSILGYSVVGTANSDAYDYTKFPSYLEDTLQGACRILWISKVSLNWNRT